MNIRDVNTTINCESLIIPAVGTVAAILYHRIRHFCRVHNDSGNQMYFEDGLWWQWDSLRSMEEKYPYFSRSQIRNSITKLIEVGLILTKNSHNFRHSKKYSAIELDDWVDSKSFKNLDSKVQLTIHEVVSNKGGVKNNQKGVKNSIRGVKNNILSVKNDTPIYLKDNLKDNLIRHLNLEDEVKADDISNLQLMETVYNQYKITRTKFTSMYSHFENYIKNKIDINDDSFDNLANYHDIIFKEDIYLKKHPMWVRLIWATKNGFALDHTLRLIKNTIKQELDSNPYIMKIINSELPYLSWKHTAIKPDDYISAWDHIANKVGKVVSNA